MRKILVTVGIVAALAASIAGTVLVTDAQATAFTCSFSQFSASASNTTLTFQDRPDCSGGTGKYTVTVQPVCIHTAGAPACSTDQAVQYLSRFDSTWHVQSTAPAESCGTPTDGYANGSAHLVKVTLMPSASCGSDTNNQHVYDTRPTKDITGTSLGNLCQYDWQWIVRAQDASGDYAQDVPTLTHSC